MELYERIKKRRKEIGLSAEEVAEKLNLNASTIYRYENKDIKKMPIGILEPLAKILKTTPAYLMGWETSEFNLSEHEKEVIKAYRSHKDTQPSIDKLLDVQDENSFDIADDIIKTVNTVSSIASKTKIQSDTK